LTLYAMMATALPVAASSLWEVAWHTWKNHWELGGGYGMVQGRCWWRVPGRCSVAFPAVCEAYQGQQLLKSIYWSCMLFFDPEFRRQLPLKHCKAESCIAEHEGHGREQRQVLWGAARRNSVRRNAGANLVHNN
jgi:hypothetical protein